MLDSGMGELVRRIADLERRAARLEETEQGPGPVFLTTQLTSASWDGDAKTSANNGIIDLSAVFGAPAGVKAVLVSMNVYSATGQLSVSIKPDSDASSAPPLNAHTVAAGYSSRSAWVPCDANGDVYFLHGSATAATVWIEIWGYAL